MATHPGGNWQGGRNWGVNGKQGRHHRPAVTFGFGGPYYYDYAMPYDDYYGYGCYQIRFIRGAYRRVWVCD
jgi:hypothetical protein